MFASINLWYESIETAYSCHTNTLINTNSKMRHKKPPLLQISVSTKSYNVPTMKHTKKGMLAYSPSHFSSLLFFNFQLDDTLNLSHIKGRGRTVGVIMVSKCSKGMFVYCYFVVIILIYASIQRFRRLQIKNHKQTNDNSSI